MRIFCKSFHGKQAGLFGEIMELHFQQICDLSLSFQGNKYLRSPSDACCHLFSASSQDPLLPLLFLTYLFLSCAEIGLELFTVGRHEALNQLADI